MVDEPDFSAPSRPAKLGSEVSSGTGPGVVGAADTLEDEAIDRNEFETDDRALMGVLSDISI